jgi:hypothetical protein
MLFTTAQLLELTGMSAERLRHWKKVLPPIADRDGRSGRYTFEEIAALAVIAYAVEELEMQIAVFSGMANEIFGVFAEERVESPGAALCISRDEVALAVGAALPEWQAMAVIRTAPILEALMSKLHASARAQFDLPI